MEKTQHEADSPDESADARRRRLGREWKRAHRASLTPEERAAARLLHDANYREAHREQRRAYDKHYRRRS